MSDACGVGPMQLHHARVDHARAWHGNDAGRIFMGFDAILLDCIAILLSFSLYLELLLASRASRCFEVVLYWV